MSVFVHLADNFEEIEALAVVDILRRGGVDVSLVSVTGHKQIVGAHGIKVTADILFEDADYDTCEMIVLPGGSGFVTLRAHDGLGEKIQAFAAAGKWVSAICASPAVLAARGVLDGKKATIYAGMEDLLTGAIYSPERVVIDGNIITSKGPCTALDFGYTLLGLLKGQEKAEEIKAEMLY